MATDAPLSIERLKGKSFGSRLIRLTGPLTLKNLFEFQTELRSGQPPLLTILDLTAVPYMDSAGMGAVLNYYVHCEKNGIKLVCAGVSARVFELFKLTHVDSLLTVVPTAEDAE
jgi:anti-sigma B factor antagonist